jgi:AcrR family transcriptional regulator
VPKTKTSSPSRGKGSGPRTRGGWTPVGTAAERRANYPSKGTAKGRQTRAQLLEAARTVFERKGYIDASVEDIVTEAGVARGSFYTYFEDKLEVFRLLSSEVNAAVMDAVSDNVNMRGGDPILRLHQSIARFIEVYREYAALYGLIEQVATLDPVIHAERVERRRVNVERVTATIERWQRRGLADPDVDAATTAAVLLSMTSNFCYWWFVGEETYDQDQATITLTETWVRAVDLRRTPRDVTHVARSGADDTEASA